MTVCIAQIPKSPKDIGTYMGQGMLIVALGALIGPPVSGALVNRYHDFKEVSIFSGVVSIVGGFLVLLVKYTAEGGIMGKI